MMQLLLVMMSFNHFVTKVGKYSINVNKYLKYSLKYILIMSAAVNFTENE